MQKLAIASVSPETAAEIERQSRNWMIRCPHCGFERSVWEAGGVRYKAAGTPRQHRTCANCGRAGWHQIQWAGPPGEAVPAGNVVKLVLGIVAGSLLLSALVVALVLWLTGVI